MADRICQENSEKHSLFLSLFVSFFPFSFHRSKWPKSKKNPSHSKPSGSTSQNDRSPQDCHPMGAFSPQAIQTKSVFGQLMICTELLDSRA
jgi:hypothetical protein